MRRRNPNKTPKTQKMIEEEAISESETSKNSSSDEPKTPENELTEYEIQRNTRVSQNKAKMEALGLLKIANSLVDLFEKDDGKGNSLRKSKRVSKKGKEDVEYEPNDDEEQEDDDGSDSLLKSSSEEFDGDDEDKQKKKRKKKNLKEKKITEKVKNRKLRSSKRSSLQISADTTDLMDEDEALKQAIALSLNDFGETSNEKVSSYNEKSYEHSQEYNRTKKKKPFKSRVQMTEDDLVVNFCQIDEVGKGSIILRDLQRMASSHDFTWTDKELVDMIRCFNHNRDGKLTLDDFRNIVLRCNMLQVPENA